MRHTTFTLLGLLGATSATYSGSDIHAAQRLLGTTSTTYGHDLLAAQGLDQLKLHIAKHGHANPKKCTLETAAVRPEWSSLNATQKLEYIGAVKCMAKKPARTPAAVASGARSRYDDFVVTHILQSMTIHGTGLFFVWHRLFIWVFERALRDECGYKGYLPYNNWSKWADDPLNSPLFDGSVTSFSGDGAFVPGRKPICLPSRSKCYLRLKPANGGGCLTSGPFMDWTVNLGPVDTYVPGVQPNPQSDGLGYNPRCLTRDINPQATNETRDEYVVSLIRDNEDIFSFQNRMTKFYPGSMGLHTGLHYGLGGESSMDMYNSASDPVFYFLHAMIDRAWTTWQHLDLPNRQNALSGSFSYNNAPSRDLTLEDVIRMEYVGIDNITIAETMNTLAGPFCYIYA